MIPEEAVEAAVEVLIADSGWCECRHNPRDKHDVNPPCSTRRRATIQARTILEAAAPHMLAGAWDEGCKEGLSWNPGYDNEALATNPYKPTP